MTFPKVNPKQSFPKLEEEILKYWKENDIFKASIETRKDCEEFKFYDGPPFATGTPHYGHLVGGTIKDVIPRYQTMKGRKVERNFGWDCHGLPIENIVEKKLEISGKDDIESKIGVYDFNETCRANVFGYVDEWRKTVERMGRWVDMDNDYKTMDTDFMESVWWTYKTIYDKGLIYEGHRVVPYCPRCSTPLSNFEVNQGYKDKQSKTVTVKFKVAGSENKYILAWTTTPWTLYANLGLAVGENITYVELLDKTNGDTYILAREKVKDYFKPNGIASNGEEPVPNETDSYKILREYTGSCLVGIKYEPIFPDFEVQFNDMGKDLGTNICFGKNTYSVVLGHHVTTETGTGIVHIAPAYGEDDNIIGEKENLGFFMHIDDSGKTYNLLDKNGLSISDINESVLLELKERKVALHIATINHSYPHCWRCDTPLIYRAISAWYVAVEKIREKMLANNAKIHWVPELIKEGRFGKWLEGARDWNISRNRYWGSAIPVWQSKDKKEEVCIGSIEELYQKNRDFGQITKVILVRHGYAESNENRYLDGKNIANLVEKGIKQAEEIKNLLKNEKIDVIYSSPFDRALDTIKPLVAELGVEVIKDNRLTDLDFGELQGKFWTEKQSYNYYLENKNEKVGNIGESYIDFEKRIEETYNEIIKNNPGKNIVICSHGDPLFKTRTYIKGVDFCINNHHLYPQNKFDNILEQVKTHYIYTNTGKEVDLHKHFVDEIFIKGEEKSLEVKNVLGIHGFLRSENVIDFILGTKINLEKEGINFDAPKFEIGEKINYKNWEKKLDEIGLEKYNTIIAHSMGGRVAMEYIIEHKIKLERLILVAPSISGSGRKEIISFYSEMKHNFEEIKNFVKEIIVIVSKDDSVAGDKEGKELAQKINANLIETNGYGHFNVKECNVIEDIIKYGNQKTINVLGVHGRSIDLENDNHKENWGLTKEIFNKNGINLDLPQFDISTDPIYESWKQTFDTINFSKYDAIYTRSLGSLMTIKYLSENNIKVKKLIMAVPGKSFSTEKGEKPNIQKIWESLNDNSYKNLADEVIVVSVKDDEKIPFENGKKIAEKLNATFISLENGNHHFGDNYKLIAGIIKKSKPTEINVLGIHGRKTSIQKDTRKRREKAFQEKGMNLDLYQFDNSENATYESWKTTFDTIDFSKYNSIFTGSRGGAITVAYLCEKKIKLKRLVMLAPGKSKNVENAMMHIYENLEKKGEILKQLVDEIIVIHSKDDEIVPSESAKYFANKMNAQFIEISKTNHKYKGYESLCAEVVKNGMPLQRIPEVLDCWFESGSMPYASRHYPFAFSENGKLKTDNSFKFPADFIAEGLDQTRGWFYTLLILGTALFDNTPFMNCIVNGIVLAEDGKKMSKRLNNYPEPEKIFNTYGADAMRFYLMNSPVVEAQDLRFSESGVEEVVKKIILPLWNTYSFFTTYANIDHWKTQEGKIYFCRHGQTDNNKNNMMNGGDDNTPLNEKGIAQAHELGKITKIKNRKIDIIISSHLSRAYNTAKIIAEEIGYTGEIIIDERLRDQDSGALKGKNREAIKKEFNLKNDAEFRKFFRDKKNNQVESVEEFEERVLKSYEEIQEKYKGKNILITAHTGTIRPIIKKLDNLTSDEAYYENGSIPNATIIKLPTSERKNILDKWILGELHNLIKEVEQGMDNYKIAEATRPIINFMDNLTNWYIRRSRKRFWKSENDNDKLQAYETLYEVLTTFCRIIAPFMPFVSEHIYRNLTNKKSVHLDSFPKSVNIFINEDINSQFEKTARLVNLGLAWRQRNNLRVRQVLSSATIGEKLEDYYCDIIKDELNVKELIILDNSDKIAKKICKPNARLIGPKFGQDVKFIMNEAKSGNFEELEDGKVKVANFILEKDEYEIAFEAGDSSFDIEAGFGMVIALDKNLTPELIQEGIARDIVRQIQEARKEASFEVSDRIQLCLKGENLEDVIKNFGDYIQAETLSSLVENIKNPDIEKNIELEERKIVIELKR